MCHLAIAEIAASLEMSCVTIVFRLLRESVCKLSCANSLGLPLVLLVQPQGFGKPTESPSWCSAAGQLNSSLPTKCCLLAGPGTVSISVTPLAACGRGLGVPECRGCSWCLGTHFPNLCHGSLASRRVLSFSLLSFSLLLLLSSPYSGHHVCRQTSVCTLKNAVSSLGELYYPKSQNFGRRLLAVSYLKV